jgi:protoporphyrinogen oxidase
MAEVVILGGGLAGLSTAYHLKRSFLLFEKEERVGGLCRSIKKDGFTFDFTGHLLHFRRDEIKNLVFSLLEGNIPRHRRRSFIYSKGVYTRYPFQANSYGLPPEVQAECILGFIEAQNQKKKEGEIRTFEDWTLYHFGKGIANHFMVPYNEKLWTVHPRRLTTDWLKRFVPTPSLREVISGALSDQRKGFGYNAFFYYPGEGGIEVLPRAITSRLPGIRTGIEAKKIAIREKKVLFSTGEYVSYRFLVSTLPLPELIRIITPAPEEIKKAAESLAYASVYNLNLGIKGRRRKKRHWIYFPEPEFPFYRIGSPPFFSNNMAPPGFSSVYTEVSYSRHRPLDKASIYSQVVAGLIRAGIIKGEEEIVCRLPLDINYGYVIYDEERRKSLPLINEFLNGANIYSIGRYGAWEYSAMEDALFQGKKTAYLLNG